MIEKRNLYAAMEQFGRSFSAIEKDVLYARGLKSGIWWRDAWYRERHHFRAEQAVPAINVVIISIRHFCH